MESIINATSLLALARKQQQESKVAEAEATCRKALAETCHDEVRTALHILLALIHIQTDRVTEAKRLFEQLGDIHPEDAAAQSDLGLLLMLRGDINKAYALLELATSSPASDHAAWARFGAVRLVKNELEGAEAAFREALARSPEHPAILNNLGGALMRRNKYEEALEAYESALRLAPNLPVAEKGRAAALLMMERADELLAEYDEALEQDPGAVPILMNKVHVLVLTERLDEAREILRDLTDSHPDDPEFRLQLASLHLREDQFRPALSALKEANERFPDKPAVLNLLARCYSELGRHEEALTSVNRCLELAPDFVLGLVTRALVYSNQDKYDEAETDVRRALETHPGLAEGWSMLGHILLWKGHIDEAVECMHKAARINPGALSNLVEARAFPEDPKTLEHMERFAAHPIVPHEAKASMNFALVKVFEKQDNYDKAMHHAHAANRLVRDHIKYNHRRFTERTSAIIDTFNPDLFRRFAGLGNFSERPVFVVGMPRSGTTLTEQLLSSHPEVYGAGELGYMPAIIRLMPRVLKTRQPYPQCMSRTNERTIEHAAIYYLSALAKHDKAHRRVVDKMPHNFINIGLISIIFPYAKIIHVRRDLRDIAISNYFTNFKMKRGGMGYAFDLAEIGYMLNDYRRIMDHWRAVLPVQMYEFDYEDLVSRPEEGARALLDYIGLEWDPAVMSFYKQERPVRTASVWQVRQPIYQTSRERWMHYDKYLKPLYEVLKEYGTVDDSRPAGKRRKRKAVGN